MILKAQWNELRYDVRVVGMREAIDQMKAAANVMRVATLRLVDVDCQGAVDVASHALYEVHKATDTLERQLRDLLSVAEFEQREQSSDQRRADPQEGSPTAIHVGSAAAMKAASSARAARTL